MSTLVVDASFLVAALLNDDQQGIWATEQLAEAELIAPHLLDAETANILRRSELAGLVTAEQADVAVETLGRLRIERYPFAPFSDRIWELRANVTAYDAWYIAVAERFAAPLATLDVRLARSTGPRCSFLVPPEM